MYKFHYRAVITPKKSRSGCGSDLELDPEGSGMIANDPFLNGAKNFKQQLIDEQYSTVQLVEMHRNS